jgi:hypothetical protein
MVEIVEEEVEVVVDKVVEIDKLEHKNSHLTIYFN